MDFLPQDWLDTTIRLCSALVLSGIIGFEREVRNKPAGLRTHMLVGLGAAASCVFALSLIKDFSSINPEMNLDPIRVISGVIGGLGFLGAGAIIQSRGEVYGMTTAAGIWIVGAIGIGCGTGNYFEATLVTVLAAICLVPIRHLEHKLQIRNSDDEDLVGDK